MTQASTPRDGEDALLLLTLTGVQQLISQARTAADLWGGSTLASWLSERAGAAIAAGPGRLVLPSLVRGAAGDAAGVTNRLAVLVSAAQAREVAADAAGAVREAWDGLVAQLAGGPVDDPAVVAPATVRWVIVERDGGEGYHDLWVRAQQALVARKRVRDFPAHAAAGGEACSLCGLRHAVGLPPRVQHRAGERLCLVCARKRTFRGTVASGDQLPRRPPLRPQNATNGPRDRPL